MHTESQLARTEQIAQSARRDLGVFTRQHASVTTQPEIAGYRVGRKLGTDADADLYLGHCAPNDDLHGHRQSVTLKLFRSEAASMQVERELDVRSQLNPGGASSLLDLATLVDGRVALVLDHLAGGSLVRYLREHAPLSSGEAVTILAPIVLSLAALHRAGYALPDLSVASIEFTAEGRPLIDRWGALEQLPAPLVDGGVRRDLLSADLHRLIRMFREVFAALDPADPVARHAEGIAGWGEEAVEQLTTPDCLAGLEQALFAWSDAVPLRLGRPSISADSDRADLPLCRIARVTEEATEGSVEPEVVVGTKKTPRFVFPHVNLAWFESFRKRRATKPILVAVMIASGLIALALSALPVRETADDAAAVTAHSSATGSVSVPMTSGTDAEHAAIAADDPVAASIALLSVRAICLAESSVLCLEGVNQSGSAAMAADRYAVRTSQQADGEKPAESLGPDARLVERTGDSALVEITRIETDSAQPDDVRPDASPSSSVEEPAAGDAQTKSKPASLLIIKGEAGWRVREIFDY
jgi:serine/threonine protein kinase